MVNEVQPTRCGVKCKDAWYTESRLDKMEKGCRHLEYSTSTVHVRTYDCWLVGLQDYTKTITKCDRIDPINFLSRPFFLALSIMFKGNNMWVLMKNRIRRITVSGRYL